MFYKKDYSISHLPLYVCFCLLVHINDQHASIICIESAFLLFKLHNITSAKDITIFVCIFNLYNVVLVSAMRQHTERSIIIHISPPSLLPSSPSRSSQSPRLSSLCYTAMSHQASISHLIVYMCRCYLLHSPHSLPPTLCPQVHSLHLSLNKE